MSLTNRSTPSKRSRRQLDSLFVTESPTSKFSNTKNLLSSSYVDGLIGRDDEYKTIYDTIKNSLEVKQSSTLYISGPAGTGKTLTSHTVINDLKKQFRFKFITINCMSFQNAGDFYQKIWTNFDRKQKRYCTSTNVSNQMFAEVKDSICNAKNMIILLLDEIDQLQTKSHDVFNNIFHLPNLSNKLILIGIANALDFTAKMSWLKDQSTNFQEIRFLPYRKDQIVQIIENRLKLAQNNENGFLIDKMAVEFCARKISSCSGDIRKALDVCRRAVELIESSSRVDRCFNPLKSKENIEIKEAKPQQVNIKIMMDVLNKVYGNAMDKVDQNQKKTFLPSDQQVVLCVFLVFRKLHGIREIKLSSFRELMLKICKRNGITSEGKSESDILNMCQYLADYGYVEVIKRNSIGSSKLSGSSPFKKTPTKKSTGSSSSITLSLLIDAHEAEQLVSSFHQGIIANAFNYA